MPLPIAILLAGVGFGLSGFLGVIRFVLPLRAIDRLRIRLLSSMLCLGMGIDDAAVERIGRIPNAQAILEKIVADGGDRAIFQRTALEMVKLKRQQATQR